VEGLFILCDVNMNLEKFKYMVEHTELKSRVKGHIKIDVVFNGVLCAHSCTDCYLHSI